MGAYSKSVIKSRPIQSQGIGNPLKSVGWRIFGLRQSHVTNLNVGWVWCILRDLYSVGVSVRDKPCVIRASDSAVDSVVLRVREIDVNVSGVRRHNAKLLQVRRFWRITWTVQQIAELYFYNKSVCHFENFRDNKKCTSLWICKEFFEYYMLYCS